MTAGGGALAANHGVAAALDEPAQIAGIVGLDLIVGGRILYLSREESYLLLDEASQARTCEER